MSMLLIKQCLCEMKMGGNCSWLRLCLIPMTFAADEGRGEFSSGFTNEKAERKVIHPNPNKLNY